MPERNITIFCFGRKMSSGITYAKPVAEMLVETALNTGGIPVATVDGFLSGKIDLDKVVGTVKGLEIVDEKPGGVVEGTFIPFRQFTALNVEDFEFWTVLRGSVPEPVKGRRVVTADMVESLIGVSMAPRLATINTVDETEPSTSEDV